MLPQPLDAVVSVFLVAVGFLVGSFLNVVVWRLPRGESIVFPGSHCPRCGSPIRSRDNIPVLGWLFLGGRCRDCRGPISMRYPLVEALTGAVTWLFIGHDGLTVLLGFHLVFAWTCIALALIDLDTFLLPFVLTLPLIPLSVAAGYFDPHLGLTHAVLGAGMGWALIVVVGKVGELIAGREAMGGGDAWLMASIGGFVGPLRLVVALFLASSQGAVLGLILIKLRTRAASAEPQPPSPDVGHAVDADKSSASEGDEDDWVPPPTAVPFGPFLALGALETLLWGNALLHAIGLDFWAGRF